MGWPTPQPAPGTQSIQVCSSGHGSMQIDGEMKRSVFAQLVIAKRPEADFLMEKYIGTLFFVQSYVWLASEEELQHFKTKIMEELSTYILS